MKKYRILVITDHYTHGKGESIYQLLKTMAINSVCGGIYVATRGDERNKEFFADFDVPTVYAKRIDNQFEYNKEGNWYYDSNSMEIPKFDILFIRIDRPLTDEQLLKINSNYKELLIINDPEGIIKTGSKRFLLNFPSLCPDMTLCCTLNDVKKQLHRFPIVLKPLHGYGGMGLIRIDHSNVYYGDKSHSLDKGYELIEQDLQHTGPMLSMKYFQNVINGDKRVLVVGGKVLGAMLRTPAEGSWLCNLKQGGYATYAEVDSNEIEIAKTISPVLRKNGVVIFGFDTLEDDDGIRRLSEINTLNVGGLVQAQEFSGKSVISDAAGLIWKYIQHRFSRKQ